MVATATPHTNAATPIAPAIQERLRDDRLVTVTSPVREWVRRLSYRPPIVTRRPAASLRWCMARSCLRLVREHFLSGPGRARLPPLGVVPACALACCGSRAGPLLRALRALPVALDRGERLRHSERTGGNRADPQQAKGSTHVHRLSPLSRGDSRGPKPTCQLWLVVDRPDQKAQWVKLTGLFPTKDGDGFTGQLLSHISAPPGSRLLALPPKEHQAAT